MIGQDATVPGAVGLVRPRAHAAAAVTGPAGKALELQGLTKIYGSETVVDRFDTRIQAGEFFSLLGPSGSGKTTTLMMVAGFASIDAGRLERAASEVLRGRTALVVAHRLTQAETADHVVLMEAGRIAEEGTHAELLASGGRYSRLWEAWSAPSRR